jgi:hypothetical protein
MSTPAGQEVLLGEPLGTHRPGVQLPTAGILVVAVIADVGLVLLIVHRRSLALATRSPSP